MDTVLYKMIPFTFYFVILHTQCYFLTGKYLPGRDEPDPKRWKANFRCALNSLTDVLEVKDSSQKRGREAFKVYEFLPQIKKYRKYTYSACEYNLV